MTCEPAVNGTAPAAPVSQLYRAGAVAGPATGRTAAGGTTSPAPVKVLLHLGHELVRTGLRVVLDAESDLAVVAESAGRGDLAGLLGRLRPHVVVADFSAHVLDAARVLSEPRVAPGVPVVVLSSAPGSTDVEQALQGGARGVVLHNGSARHVLDAVRSVAAGLAYLDPAVTASLLGRFAGQPSVAVDIESRRRLDSLTPRERQVLRLVAIGSSTAHVAARLRLSRATVKSHISHLLAKLGVQERAQAVAFAYQVGLVELPRRVGLPAERAGGVTA